MANDLTAAPPAALTPADMLKIAVDQGADLDKLEKFMELARALGCRPSAQGVQRGRGELQGERAAVW